MSNSFYISKQFRPKNQKLKNVKQGVGGQKSVRYYFEWPLWMRLKANVAGNCRKSKKYYLNWLQNTNYRFIRQVNLIEFFKIFSEDALLKFWVMHFCRKEKNWTAKSRKTRIAISRRMLVNVFKILTVHIFCCLFR